MSLEGKRLEIVVAALEWWAEKRPPHWDESKHVIAPWVNCTDDRERHLASAVAEYAKRRRGPVRETERGLKAIRTKPRKERE